MDVYDAVINKGIMNVDDFVNNYSKLTIAE